MKYTIEKIETKVTWEEERAVGNVEASVWIGGMEQQTEEIRKPGLYLTSAESYTSPVLCASLVNRDGQEMDRMFPLPLEEEMQFCMRVEDPQLWNAEDPYCYQLVLEIMEGENFCQDRRVEPVAFSGWKIVDGQTCINGKAVVFRGVALPEEKKEPEDIQEFLQTMKQNFQNTLLVKTEQKSVQLQRWCLEYGIYLLEEGKDVDAGWMRARLDLEKEEESNPDFSLQVVQTGVLVENRSTFVDVSEYEMHYEVCDMNGRTISEGQLCTEISAGSSRYVDIPFEMPAQPGEYRFCVSLCLKRDTPWASKGYAVVSAETKISNLYERPEK